jgi:DNA-binding Lrp family transcriptional regulator
MGLLEVEVLCSFGSEMQKSLGQLIPTLRKLPGLFSLNVIGGEFAVMFRLHVRHHKEVCNVLDSLCSGAGLAFERRSIAICTDWELYYRKYMTTHVPQRKSFRVVSDMEKVSVDATDKAILAVLSNHPDAPLSQVSRTVGVAQSTVLYRFKALCSTGVIVGFGLSIDEATIGMHSFRIAIRAVHPTLALRKAMFAFSAQHPHVLSCSSYVGDWDYFLRVEVETPLDVFTITRDLANAISPHRVHMSVIPVLQEIHFRQRQP